MAGQLLIFTSKLGYQARSFADAARRLGAEVIFVTDRCHRLEDPWGDAAVPVNFVEPERAAERVSAAMASSPPAARGLVALGDAPLPAAALAARSLGIRFHSPESVESCRTKLRQREVLRDAGLPVPDFLAFSMQDDAARLGQRIKYPCVVKPLALSASQGVIWAGNPMDFAAAVKRIRALLASPEIAVTRDPALDQLLVESYIEGEEIAVEALLTDGELRELATFDKPDQPAGPYFEETLYVTPSQHPALALVSVEATLRRAVSALGLTHGPLHCEFRLNENGPWILEIHPRPIGGLCARALRFGPENIFLDELLVRHALGIEGAGWPRERAAGGVMMIPVPRSGTLDAVQGEEEARAVDGVSELAVTARLHDRIAAWPEGSSYLGFIFARGDSPERVAHALRLAHSKLQFAISPALAVEHPMARRA